MRANVLTALITAGLAVGSGVAIAQDYIPDHHRTPGAINHHVTQDNAALTVCVAGWTRTIRPTSSYTSKLKAQQMRTLHLPGSARDYEEDHLVPLCVGGHPTDHRNLWPSGPHVEATLVVAKPFETSGRIGGRVTETKPALALRDRERCHGF